MFAVDKALSVVTTDSCGADMALLVLPLLQFLAMPSPATGQGTHKTGHAIDNYRKIVHAASSALRKVENLIQLFTDKPVSQVTGLLSLIRYLVIALFSKMNLWRSEK